MSTYVISDIHGYFYRLQHCLAQANFDPTKDCAYILGDLCDRGPNSGKVLEWAYNQPDNIHFCLGNHEDLMLTFFHQQEEIIKYEKKNYIENLEAQEKMTQIEWVSEALWDYASTSLWGAWNGGIKTWEYLMCDIPIEHREDILKWIETWPLFYDIEVNGRRFVLVHAGLAMNGMRRSDDCYNEGLQKWIKIKDFPDQFSQSLLWIRENWFLNDVDLPCDVVFGHTPTSYLYQYLEDANDWCDIDGEAMIPIEKGKEILHFGRDLKKHCIDTGREALSLLCLDTMEEFVSDIAE